MSLVFAPPAHWISLAFVGSLSNSSSCSILPAGETRQTAITGGFDSNLSDALAKRRPASSPNGHHLSAFKMPPCSSVVEGATTELGLCLEGSACHRITLLSAAPETSLKFELMSSAPTAPVWPANVAWHFRSGLAKDQHKTYLSFEQVKRYLPSLETTTPTMGFSCRHMNSGFLRSSTSRSSLRCLRAWSSARLFSMSRLVPAGRTAMMSSFFWKTSV
mmetsp:Transcript_64506/g.129623  ORF Transcript_64506/g.129623 Transcript_64506/m.129623 type:complete len:218 (+) Transcript_64506:586-1239(+)